jgi:lysyl-tRNA synthetase class 2
MSLALNKASNTVIQGEWRPTCTISVVKARAALLASIRAFFLARDVIEVETPVLASAPVTDPFIEAFSVSGTVYLQTSPEYAMKRLLAAGFPSMYQLSKAFRHEEVGHLHNPEFTLLEWYRIGFGLNDLMDEMDALLQQLFSVGTARRFTYQNLFLHCMGLDPFNCTVDDLKKRAKQENIQVISSQLLDRDDWLRLLFTHLIEPKMGFDVPWFVCDYPASQAALSRLKIDNQMVAERFEVYYKGLELANGYHELDDPKIQMERFLQDCEKRRLLNLSAVPIDKRLVDALAFGFPNCAGVALGVDRLLMLQLGLKEIEEVLTFSWNRA